MLNLSSHTLSDNDNFTNISFISMPNENNTDFDKINVPDPNLSVTGPDPGLKCPYTNTDLLKTKSN